MICPIVLSCILTGVAYNFFTSVYLRTIEFFNVCGEVDRAKVNKLRTPQSAAGESCLFYKR